MALEPLASIHCFARYPPCVKKLKWFGVKTLYRTTAKGRVRERDRNFDADAVLIEERVVIFRARSFAEAIRKAEREALASTKTSWTSPYGQRVETEYLGACDAFEMFEAPRDGAEVFSRVETSSSKRSKRDIVYALLGPEEREPFDLRRAPNSSLGRSHNEPVIAP